MGWHVEAHEFVVAELAVGTVAPGPEVAALVKGIGHVATPADLDDMAHLPHSNRNVAVRSAGVAELAVGTVAQAQRLPAWSRA